MDKIIIDKIQVMAKIGVSKEERAHPQPIEISIILHLDLSRAARTDSLGHTLDYALIHRQVIEIVQQRPRLLIETLAEDIARSLARTFRFKRIEVEVRKFILDRTHHVAVYITRTPRQLRLRKV